MQTTVAFAMVSQELNTRTSRFILVIRRVANASARVTASGRPSGTATTMTVTAMMRTWIKFCALSLADLHRPVDRQYPPMFIGRKQGAPVGVCAELDEELDHQYEEEETTGERAELGDQFGESIQLELERGALRVASQTVRS